jgi:chromosome segregation ATPase
VSKAIPDAVDEYQERSRPVTVAPPKFSSSIPSELQHFAHEIASSFNDEANKTWQMRREFERMDKIGTAVNRLASSVDFWAATTKELLSEYNKASTVLAMLTERVASMSSTIKQLHDYTHKTLDGLNKLENKIYDNENDVNLLQALHAAMERRLSNFEASHGAHDARIKALETIRLVANSEAAGATKLITKGRAVGGVAYTLGVVIAAKWAWFMSLMHR